VAGRTPEERGQERNVWLTSRASVSLARDRKKVHLEKLSRKFSESEQTRKAGKKGKAASTTSADAGTRSEAERHGQGKKICLVGWQKRLEPIGGKEKGEKGGRGRTGYRGTGRKVPDLETKVPAAAEREREHVKRLIREGI